ncbi:hypothetical protein AHAS_Ahas15G0085600 [Arachis hypogaea]
MARWGPQESEPSVILIRDALSHSKTVNVIDKMEGRGPRGRVWANWGRECGPSRWHFPPKGNGIMKQCSRHCSRHLSGAPAVSVDNVCTTSFLQLPYSKLGCFVSILVFHFLLIQREIGVRNGVRVDNMIGFYKQLAHASSTLELFVGHSHIHPLIGFE